MKKSRKQNGLVWSVLVCQRPGFVSGRSGLVWMGMLWHRDLDKMDHFCYLVQSVGWFRLILRG